MDYAALIGMIAQYAGNQAAQAASKMDTDSIMALLKGAVDDYGKISVPKLQDLLTKVPDTQLSKIQDNPQYLQQQQAADSQLNDIINSGGMTLADKAALNNIKSRVMRGESATQGNIENGMAARGTLDSGNQLAMELNSAQNAAQQENQGGEEAAAKAQARAYAAIQDRARLAGQGLDRSYNQQANAARAQDAINQGNAAIQRSGSQQYFNNQIALANAKLNPTYALTSQYGANGQQKLNQAADNGNLLNSAIGAAGKLLNGNSGGKSNNSNNDPSTTAGNNVPSYPDDGSSSASSNIGSGDLGAGVDEGFGSYPGDSSALSGQSTRNSQSGSSIPSTSKVIVGYNADGSPVYAYRKA